MTDLPGPQFRVSHTPKVAEQVQELAKEAKRLGFFELFQAVWKEVFAKLQIAPQNWGDPLYHIYHQGGVMYRGVKTPLIMHYAVYEAEKAVWIIQIDLSDIQTD